MKIQLCKCGDELVMVLPADLVTQLGWNPGDIAAVEAVDGGVKVVRTMTAHDHAMEIARDVMDEYRETFEALAKS